MPAKNQFALQTKSAALLREAILPQYFGFAAELKIVTAEKWGQSC